MAFVGRQRTTPKWRITEPSLRFGSVVGRLPLFAFLDPEFHIGGRHGASAYADERSGTLFMFAALLSYHGEHDWPDR